MAQAAWTIFLVFHAVKVDGAALLPMPPPNCLILDKAVERPFFNAEAQRVRRSAEKGFHLACYANILPFLCGPLAFPFRLCVEMFLG